MFSKRLSFNRDMSSVESGCTSENRDALTSQSMPTMRKPDLTKTENANLPIPKNQ